MHLPHIILNSYLMNSQRPLSEPILNNFQTDGGSFFSSNLQIFSCHVWLRELCCFDTAVFVWKVNAPGVSTMFRGEKRHVFQLGDRPCSRHVDEASLHFRWPRGASGGDEIFRVSHTVRRPSGRHLQTIPTKLI